MITAAMPFKEIHKSGLKPDEYQQNPDNFPQPPSIEGSKKTNISLKNIYLLLFC